LAFPREQLIRCLLVVVVGLSLSSFSIFRDIARERQTSSEIQKKASPALAAYLGDCALAVDRYETEYPEIPYQNSKFRTVLLPPAGMSAGRSFDAMLLERFEEDYEIAQGLPTVAWPAGSGKSVLANMVRVEACRRGLQGDVRLIVLARDARRDLSQPDQRQALADFLKAMPTDFDGQPDDSRRKGRNPHRISRRGNLRGLYGLCPNGDI
jgi:hypothetical protein